MLAYANIHLHLSVCMDMPEPSPREYPRNRHSPVPLEGGALRLVGSGWESRRLTSHSVFSGPHGFCTLYTYHLFKQINTDTNVSRSAASTPSRAPEAGGPGSYFFTNLLRLLHSLGQSSPPRGRPSGPVCPPFGLQQSQAVQEARGSPDAHAVVGQGCFHISAWTSRRR